MAKQRKSKKKGIRYIARVLGNYEKKKYPKYKDRLDKAREIFPDFEKSNLNVTVRNILKLSRPKRGKKKGVDNVPKIYKKLLEESDYFDLLEYPTWITRTTNEVWFKSKLIPSGLEDIQGGSTPNYNDYFAPYVSYINSLKSLSDTDDKLYETQWRVKCTEPVYNKKNKRWESEIISCDGSGTRFDYGFNPDKPYDKPQNLVISDFKEKDKVSTKKEEKVKPELPKEPISDKEIEKLKLEKEKLEAESKLKDKELEIKRQENINDLLKLFAKGDISKQEFKELFSKIK